MMARIHGLIAVDVIETLIDLALYLEKIRRKLEYRQGLIQISLAVD